jgi:hypothetical protein
VDQVTDPADNGWFQATQELRDAFNVTSTDRRRSGWRRQQIADRDVEGVRDREEARERRDCGTAFSAGDRLDRRAQDVGQLLLREASAGSRLADPSTELA